VIVLDVKVWQTIAGQIHQQLRHGPLK